MKEQNKSIEIINYLMNAKGISKRGIMKITEVSNRMIDLVINGDRNLGADRIQKIAEHLNITVEELKENARLAWHTRHKPPRSHDFALIKKISARPRCGDGGFEVDFDNEDGGYTQYAFRKSWLQGRDEGSLCLFDVVGDSMEGELHNGDTILVDLAACNEWVVDRIYLITIEESFMVKKAGIEPGFRVLKSCNEDKGEYPDIKIPMENDIDFFKVHGRVIGMCRSYI